MTISRFHLFIRLVLISAFIIALLPALGRAQPAGHVVISEVMYDPVGTEPGAEWVELHNPTAAAVALSGWQLRDNGSTDTIPAFSLNPGAFLVIASSQSAFLETYPGFTGNLVGLESPIGNGLSNTGDRVRLLDAAGAEIDAMSYGTDATVFAPACPDVPEGQSLVRVPVDQDADSAADWAAQAAPNPGGPGAEPAPTSTHTRTPAHTPTPTATAVTTATPTATASLTPLATAPVTPTPSATATPTATSAAAPSVTPSATLSGSPTPTWTPTPTLPPSPAPGLLLSEVLYDAVQSGVDSNWEWIEIHNPTGAAVDLAGWAVGDAGAQDALPAFTLGPGGYVVVVADETSFRENHPGFTGHLLDLNGPIGAGLSNTGDALRLYAPDAVLVDAMSYGSDTSAFAPACPTVAPGQSLARVPPDRDTDTRDDWLAQAIPNPGAPGTMLTPTPTSTHTHTPTAPHPGTPTVTPTATASLTPIPTATGTATPSGTPAATDTATPTGLPTATLSHTPTVLPVTGTPTPTGTPAATAPPTPLSAVRLNEVLPYPYDVDWDGNGTLDAEDEWIEIYNLGAEAMDLGGWALDDIEGGSKPYVFPADTWLAPGGFRVFYRSQTKVALNQDADTARLLAPDGSAVDTFAYSGPKRDTSYSRTVDGAGVWTDAYPPSPGGPNIAPAPTPTFTPTLTYTPTLTRTPTATRTPTLTRTPTATRTATSTRTPTTTPTWTVPPTPTPTATPVIYDPDAIRLNEFLPAPGAVDWDGDGTADAADEWIELYNLGLTPVNLAGWALDDIADGGSKPFVFPASASLAPGGFLVIYRTQSGLALNNDTDTVRLLGPDGAEVDDFSYTTTRPDGSYSRAVDGTGAWTDSYPPSPGGPNLAPTPTPTATPVIYDPDALRLNEFLPAPSAVDWNGDGTADAGDEWIEVYNRSAAAVDLAGWLLDDSADGGSTPYVFPAGVTLAPGAFLLVFQAQSGLVLNNTSDTVRLLGPDVVEVDAFAYSKTQPDRSYSRTVDGAGAWTDTYAPSPGGPNIAPTPTPTPTATATATPIPAGITLNEILPDPVAGDWDGNGQASFNDEWIELYHAGTAPANLGGWAVLDDTKTYTIPQGTVIWPRSFLLLFRRATGLSLGDRRDHVILRRPDGVTADEFAYTNGPGEDRSFCRSVDGGGYWTTECDVTVGQPNRLRPTPVPGAGGGAPPMSGAAAIAAALAAPDDTRVTVTGAVVYPPGLIPRTIYLQDATGGIKVYLRSGDYPALAVGDVVQATGWTRDFRGEAELSVPNPGYLTRLGAGQLPIAARIATGDMGEAHQGQLVLIVGRVTKFERQALVLDDGSGPARIYFPGDLPWRRPYVNLGEFWVAQGVVGQYAFDGPPWVGGYRLLPRFRADVSPPPAWLPVTGSPF